jgi:hypothetical protein
MNSKRMTKADRDWASVFERYQLKSRIAAEGFVDVNSQDLKGLGLEPRLLTKIDHSHQVPMPLKESNLSILTLSNSMWRIGPFDIFRALPKWAPLDQATAKKTLPDWITSIDPANITGEGGLINAAFSSEILSDFCGEELVPTVSGKGRSGQFSFRVDQFNKPQAEIHVDSAQIEIDAGYEGRSALYLFEAKKHISIDFNIRQLYYPYRAWNQRVSKPVKTIFITFANDVFDLSEYSFTDPQNLSSASLLRHKRYTLSGPNISRRELINLAQRCEVENRFVGATSAPFPQADDFERVMDMTSFLGERPRTADDIATNYEFHVRQSDYYFSALKFLGLAEKVVAEDGQRTRVATPLAQKILSLPPKERKLTFAEILLGIPPIREAFMKALATNSVPSAREIEESISKDAFSLGIAGSTVHRRAQTIQAWARWILELSDRDHP